jgi:mRNA interferase HigB
MAGERVDFLGTLYQYDIMLLIGQDVLVRTLKTHSDARKWIASWVATVEDAQWQSLEDIRSDYPSADGVKLKSRLVVTVFNVKGNEYRLLTNVDYQGQVVQVLELMSHAEYDKDRWKERY